MNQIANATTRQPRERAWAQREQRTEDGDAAPASMSATATTSAIPNAKYLPSVEGAVSSMSSRTASVTWSRVLPHGRRGPPPRRDREARDPGCGALLLAKSDESGIHHPPEGRCSCPRRGRRRRPRGEHSVATAAATRVSDGSNSSAVSAFPRGSAGHGGSSRSRELESRRPADR